MSRPRILFALYDFPPLSGGMSRYYFNLLAHLPPDEIVVLTLQRDPMPHTPYPVITVQRPDSGLFSLKAYPFWLRVFDRIRAQYSVCAIFNGHLGFAKVSWLYRKWRPHIRYGIFFHGLDILKERQKGQRNPLKRLRFQAMVHSADLCVVNSQATASLLHDTVSSPPQVVVVYPGVDPQRFRVFPEAKATIRARLELPQDRKILIFVGRPVQRKGLDLLLQVLRELPEDLLLVVLGPGEFHRFQALAEDLGVASRVVFRGFVTEEDLVAYYNAADLFVMPVHHDPKDFEGFGLVYLEANACGLAVIGTRTGGIPEAVEDGVNGLLLDPDDPQALRQAILRLIRDPDLRQKLGQQGRQRVLERFLWPQQAERLRKAYLRLCESSK